MDDVRSILGSILGCIWHRYGALVAVASEIAHEQFLGTHRSVLLGSRLFDSLLHSREDRLECTWAPLWGAGVPGQWDDGNGVKAVGWSCPICVQGGGRAATMCRKVKYLGPHGRVGGCTLTLPKIV